MKTSLDIPKDLLEDAMCVSGAKTKRAVVLTALEELKQRGKLRKLAQRLGDSDSFMSAEVLDKMRQQEMPE